MSAPESSSTKKVKESKHSSKGNTASKKASAPCAEIGGVAASDFKRSQDAVRFQTCMDCFQSVIELLSGSAGIATETSSLSVIVKSVGDCMDLLKSGDLSLAKSSAQLPVVLLRLTDSLRESPSSANNTLTSSTPESNQIRPKALNLVFRALLFWLSGD